MKHETVTLLTPNIRFPVLMLCPMSFSPSSLEREGEGEVHFCHLERLAIFFCNLNHSNKTSWEKLSHTQVWNLKYLSLTIVLFLFFLFFLLFAVIFANFFPYSKNYIIKMKYVLLELKNTMTHEWGISESYNGGHNILELSDILLSVFLTTSETEWDCY